MPVSRCTNEEVVEVLPGDGEISFQHIDAGLELESGSKDAALLLTLNQGVYTFHLSGVGNTTGVGLVELFLFE